jgi:hypothetical protein
VDEAGYIASGFRTGPPAYVACRASTTLPAIADFITPVRELRIRLLENLEGNTEEKKNDYVVFKLKIVLEYGDW